MNLVYFVIISFNFFTLVITQFSLWRRPFQREINKNEYIERELNSTSDYIELYGYTAEHHNVISADGFLISVFRIPSDGTPILFQHELFLASDSWVLQGPEYDLAYILADRGYDIWIADNRGNTFSRSHLRLSPKNSKFWNFSFHEMGVFDMPAVVDYILQMTGKEKVDIIGHSIGATSALIMCSTHTEYNDKVRSLITFAPAVFFNNSIQSNLREMLTRYEPHLKFLHSNQGVDEFFPKSDFSIRASKIICRSDSPLYHLCIFYLQNVLGFTSITKQHHKPAIDYAHAAPRGVSYKSLMHLFQMTEAGKLIHFDYGPKTNIAVYGIRQPPEYNVGLITTPIALIYSDGDVHISPQDVEELKIKLPNVIGTYRIENSLFNHMDFIWGSNAKDEVFEFVLEILNHFDNENIDS